MTRPLINPGNLVWSGEHWLLYLRQPGASVESGRVSIYHTRYSAAGEGTVAYIEVPGEPGFRGACTDNREVARFVSENRIPFDKTLPIIDAEIKRQGDIRHAPSWSIKTVTAHIVATWSSLGAPLVIDGFAPQFRNDVDFTALFVFADVATVTLNGQLVSGAPYEDDAWLKTLGGQWSSCMFALAETMTRVPGK
jgi:hypothetical protein